MVHLSYQNIGRKNKGVTTIMEVAPSPILCPRKASHRPRLETIREEKFEGLEDD